MGPLKIPKPTLLMIATSSDATMCVTGLFFNPEKPAETQSEMLGAAIVIALSGVNEKMILASVLHRTEGVRAFSWKRPHEYSIFEAHLPGFYAYP